MFRTFLAPVILLFASSLAARPIETIFLPYAGKDGSARIRTALEKRMGEKAKSAAVLAVAEKVLPWAALEGLNAADTARTIDAMSRAVEQGFPFEEAEDLIPVASRRDFTPRDWTFALQYQHEMVRAKIPEQTRQLFFSRAVERKWDGLSLLAGGRGLVLARGLEYDPHRYARRILRTMPAAGFQAGSDKVSGEVKKALPWKNELPHERMLLNLKDLESGMKERSISPTDLERTLKNAQAVDEEIGKIAEINLLPRPHVTSEEPDDPDFIKDDHGEIPGKADWKKLSVGALEKEAKAWLGVPYLWGGETKKGVDCTGLTREVLAVRGIGVPKNLLPHSGDQAKAGVAASRTDLRPGDLIFFSASPNEKKITHVGLVMTATTFIHARTDGVKFDRMEDAWWKTRFVLARRIFEKIDK